MILIWATVRSDLNPVSGQIHPNYFVIGLSGHVLYLTGKSFTLWRIGPPMLSVISRRLCEWEE